MVTTPYRMLDWPQRLQQREVRLRYIRAVGDTTAATAMAVPVVRAQHTHPVLIVTYTEIATPYNISLLVCCNTVIDLAISVSR